MKSLSICALTTIFLGLLGSSSSRADEQPPKPAEGATDQYELRIYSDGFFHDIDKPDLKTRIKIGSLFFVLGQSQSPVVPSNAPNGLPKPPKPLYVASGVLHPPVNGKFPMDFTLLCWTSSESNITYGPNMESLELGKASGHYGADGVVHGYTIILTKVVPPVEPTAK